MDAHGTPVDLAIPLRFSMIVHIDDALISHREAATCVGFTSTSAPLKLECPLLPTMMWSCATMQ
jgi:hypothetical protein